jgi:hypothetical protein
MSDSTADAAVEVDVRLRRDGITVDAEERDRLIANLPIAQDWIRQLQFAETRYAEPAITHHVR